MSDDKLQLTASDYNAEAADEYAAGDAGSPRCWADEAENIELPACTTSSKPSLPGGCCFGPPAAHPDRDPCPASYDVQQSAAVTELPTERYHHHHHQQQQQQQQPHPRSGSQLDQHRPRSTAVDTPKRMSCTPRQWAAIGVCLVVKIIIIFLLLWIRYKTRYSR